MGYIAVLTNHFVTCWDTLAQNSGIISLLLTLIARTYSEKNLRKITRYHPSTGGKKQLLNEMPWPSTLVQFNLHVWRDFSKDEPFQESR